MNERGKSIDKTFLSLNQAEDRGFIHRDYIAHCLRWTHVVKRLYERKTYQSARILDIGCGRELPLAKLLYSSRLIPAMYYGVDVGPINDEDAQKLSAGKMPHTLWERTNMLELTQECVTHHGYSPGDQLPNIVVCFECLEHVEPAMMMNMLEHMKKLTTPGARFFISTPCWNRTDCAANHVNEMLYESLGATFERHGFFVENVYGTFASIRDYEHLLKGGGWPSGKGEMETYPDLRWAFDKLREYYDTNFLSCIFAPLFPAQSRNCLWELSKCPETLADRYKFPPITDIQQPWSSSTNWKDMQL